MQNVASMPSPSTAQANTETPIIETRDLVVRYNRKLTAVDHLSLSVPRGAIYGFVGPNGAGKTSTMRVLTTLMRPTEGQALVGGQEVTRDPRAVRRAIGYMPDFFGVYDDMKVWEYLDFFAACYEIPERDRGALISDLLQLVDLGHRREDMVDTLSRGMKQRLCLARTLVHDPQVLILDEPASGLDPRARVEIRELMLELSRMGKTIFFSSHILADVSEICTHIGIIEAGQMVIQGALDEVRRRLMPHRAVIVTLLDKVDEAKQALGAIEGVQQIVDMPDDSGKKRLRVEFNGDDSALTAMMTALTGRGVPVVNFSEQSHDLEDVFMKVTKGLVT
ncbi:MAG: ABC transporter ATP-binding protein [Aggregatilineales bacterium]